MRFVRNSAHLKLRRRISNLVIAGLLGVLTVPFDSVLFASFSTPANAFTPSTSEDSYADVPFSCEPKLYQIGTPSSNYPTAGGNKNLRLFTYAPLSNTFTPSEKYEDTMPAITHGIGYNTSDNFLYGIYVTNPKRIVRIDATGNIKKLGTFSWSNPVDSSEIPNGNKGDYWIRENKLIIGSFKNFATLDLTNLQHQVAEPLNLGGDILSSADDVTIIGDTMYGLEGTKLNVINLHTRLGVFKTVIPVKPSGSTVEDIKPAVGAANVLNRSSPNHSGDRWGASFADSTGNLFFFNNQTLQVWMITADQLSQDTPTIKPVGNGKSFVTGTDFTLIAPNDGASCPNAPSPYSSVITGTTADSISMTSATFSTASFPITVNPIGISTTVKYCYGNTSATSGGALLNCTLTPSSPSNASVDTPLAGSSAVTLNPLSVTGLSPGTTYFWQVVTTSEWATTYGSVNSFTTAAPPIVSTTAATNVAVNSAVLNGFIDPENNSITTSFCYGTSLTLENCTSLSGTPSSLSGSSNTAISLNLSGLTAGTTYYYKTVGTYSGEQVSGNIVSFTTPAPPTVTRTSETNVSSLGVQLNGSVNPQGAVTTVSFCLGTNANLAGCSVVNANESPLIVTTTPFTVSANIGSLEPSTTYYYNIVATNSNGSSSTTIHSFRTAAPPLEVTTQTGGLPQGTVGTQYSNSLVAAGGSQPYSWLVSAGSLPDGLALNTSTGAISGTPANPGSSTFTIKVTDSANVNTFKQFTMAVVGSPLASTSSPSSITGTTASLNGSVNPRNLITAVSFCYGTSASFVGCTQVTPSQSPLAAGTSNIALSSNISNLIFDTTYYVRILASNNSGSTTGSSTSFRTSSPPVVTTGEATSFNQAGTSATLNAVVNPKASQTAVTFCYGTSPTLVSCNSVSATQSPLASSAQDSSVSLSLSGLSPNTVYYFNTKAVNSVGTTFGSTISFTTPTGIVPPPTISQISPSSVGDISGSSVTITGTGFSTTGALAQVTIGGIAAPVTSRTGSTGLVVTAPPGTAGVTTVVVTNVDGQSASSGLLSFTSSAPTSVSGTVADTQSLVSWTATSGQTITNYLVQYSSNSGGSWTSVPRSASTTPSMLVTGLVNGTSYIFRVAAISSVGTGTFSSNSSEVTPQTVPGQPTGLSGNPGNGQAILTWEAPADNGGRNITTYKVEYSTNGGNSWTDYPHPNSNSTSLVVTGLNNGTAYNFRVAATNSVGTGTYSSASTTVNLVAPLSLTFGNRPIAVIGEPAGTHSVSATTSPANTGTTVFASATPSICGVNPSSGALTILAIGTCRITANNAGTANYSAAPTQSQDIPVSSGSLAGLNSADLDFLTSASIFGSTSYLLNASSPDTQLSLTIPSNALPSGTLVKIYLNRNLTTAGQLIPSTSYLLNFVVGWMNTNDGSLPIATTPLVINAVNASIKKGMVGYGILNGVPTPLGTATSDGSITLYMTEDPLLVVVSTKPDSPTGVQASSGLSQSSLVSWTVPANNGGETITGYRVTASPGGRTCTASGAAATSCTVNNLEVGTSYTFTVKAINPVGDSNASGPSTSITTLGAPTVNPPSSGGGGGGGSVGGGLTAQPPVEIVKPAPKTPISAQPILLGPSAKSTLVSISPRATSVIARLNTNTKFTLTGITPGVPAKATITGSKVKSINFPTVTPKGSSISLAGVKFSMPGTYNLTIQSGKTKRTLKITVK